MFGRTRHRSQFNHHVYHHQNPYLHPFRQQSQPYYPNLPEQWDPSYLSQYAPHQFSHQQGFNPYPVPQNIMNNHAQGGHGANSFYNYHMQQYGPAKPQSYAKSIFQNPLEPEKNQYQSNANQQSQANPYMNPYPKQSFIPKQPSGVQSIMNSFKTQDGTLDFNKVMDTAGNMMNAVSQVSSMVKGIGGFIKV